MLKDDIDRFKTQAESSATETQPELQGIVKNLEEYILTGEPCVFHFWSDETYDQFVKILGISEVDSAAISKTYYQNTMDNDFAVYNTPSYTDERPIALEVLLSGLADQNAGLSDYPNDFKIAICLTYDEMTTIVVGQKSEEEPGVCEDCRSSQDYTSSDFDFGCDHDEPYSYRAEHWAIVIKTNELERVNYEDGTVFYE